MLDWKTLKNDLPEQVQTLCDFGFEFSTFLDSIDEDVVFETIKQFRLLISSFERLRQEFKTIVFSKALLLEKIKVPVTEYPVEEKDEKKMIILPIKKYIEKFEKDLILYYSTIEDMIDEGYEKLNRIKLFNKLRSFETYVFDLINFSKQQFYLNTKPYQYDERLKIKYIVTNVVDWKLEQLNEVARFVLEDGIPLEDYSKVIGFFIITLKSITSQDQLREITLSKIKNKYLFIGTLISNIKKKKVMINNSSTKILIPKLKIANEPPFNKKFNRLTKEDISHSFQFPTPDDEQKFWEIFLSSTIRRAGLISELKDKLKQQKGGEVIIE